MDEQAAAWWNEQFRTKGGTLFPADIAERLSDGLPGQVECVVTGVFPDQGRVSIELLGTDAMKERIWFIGETLWLEPDRHIYADLVQVEEGRQGDGIGKTLMRNCFILAEELSLDELRLRATWVGAYAWLRFGFVPSGRDWNGDVKARLTEKLLEYKPQLDRSAFNRVLSRLANDSAYAAWLIADDDAPVQVGGAGQAVPLGRALLADTGVNWNGRLPLSDEAAVARFKRYVGMES